MEENVIRVDHVYNGKMGMVLGKTANGISLKQTCKLNSPTLIVNKRPVSKLATFSPSHINLNGRSKTGNSPEVITTSTRFSVLSTTMKSNISSTKTKYVVTKANSGGKQIQIFNDDCKENNLGSKQCLVKAASKDLIRIQDSPMANATIKSSDKKDCTKPIMNQKSSTEIVDSETDLTEFGINKKPQGNGIDPNTETSIASNDSEMKNGEIKNTAKSDKTQPIVCNICEGEDKKFIGHAAFKLHYNENHCLQHCEICQADCFGSIGLHKHMLEKHVENKPKMSHPVLHLPDNITKTIPIENSFDTNNVKAKLPTSQSSIPLQRTMKDIRYHQEVIPKNCNPKRYKTLHRCQECKYMTYHGQNLNRHIDSFHHKRSCSYCGVVCTGKKPLTDHLRLVHQVKVSPEKFTERKSNSEDFGNFSNATKKLTSTLLKKSKNWEKSRMVDQLKSNWSKKISKHGKIDYNKLSAKQRMLRNIRKELNFSSNDQRKRSEVKTSLLYRSGEIDDDEDSSGKCPYCDMILSNKDLMCQHIESEHGIALKFRSQLQNVRSSTEDDDESNDGNSHSATQYNIQIYNKANGLKRKRYSSESSHNGSTDDYDEDDGPVLHLEQDKIISPSYNDFFLEAEYSALNKKEVALFENEISNGDSESIENIMQKAFCNVMSYSSSAENSTELCFSDSENIMPVDDDDAHHNEEIINDSPSSFAKCLPTNEDLAAWELFRDF